MRQSQYFSEFRRAASQSRLEPYFDHSPNRDETQAFGTYLWNLALCESLYPALQGVEVALRNAIHEAASVEFEDEFWFKSQLTGYERKQIEEIEKSLPKLKTPVTPGRFIAECNFGFWENLFNGNYEHILWRRMLRATFPYAPRHLRKRKGIRARLDRIRRLRNRVFHHEPIWHLPDLPEQHRLILETIGWISPAMLAATKLLDRFESVYTRGSQPYTAELETIAQNWNAQRLSQEGNDG